MKFASMMLFLSFWFLPLGWASGRLSEERCGWLESESPGQLSFVDEDSVWEISRPEGYVAGGSEKLPDLSLTDGKRQGACVCLGVVMGYSAHRVEEILGAEMMPKEKCDSMALLPKRSYREQPRKNEPPGPRPEPSPVPFPESEEQGSPPLPPFLPLAEIQIFFGYEGPNRYAHKKVSLPEALVSAEALYPDYGLPNTGACFKGDPEEALLLLERMVAKMNVERKRFVFFLGWSYFDRGRTNREVLGAEILQENGESFLWFERIRECDRWSTAEERAKNLSLPEI